MVGNWVTFSIVQTPGQSQQFNRDSKIPWVPRMENKHIEIVRKKKEKAECLKKGAMWTFLDATVYVCINIPELLFALVCILLSWMLAHCMYMEHIQVGNHWNVTQSFLEWNAALCRQDVKIQPKISNPFQSMLSPSWSYPWTCRTALNIKAIISRLLLY